MTDCGANPPLGAPNEGTSALNGITESAVMEAVANLARRKTILRVAHRLSTGRICDQIVLLDGGRVSGSGTYAELLRSNEMFRAMANSGSVFEEAPNERAEVAALGDVRP